MLRSILLASFLFLHFVGLAQTKDVEINQLYRYTVPEGKVLELTNSKSYKLILSDGASRSGSACNSALYSNPRYVYGISYYENIEEREKPKTIGFTFQDINHYQDDVYQIKPYYILYDDMGMDDLQKSLNWKFKSQKIIFYPGMSVFPSSCMKSIMLTQRDISVEEKKAFDIIKKKRLEREMSKDREIALSKKIEYQNKENLEKQKFNNPKSIYTDSSIYNIDHIKFSDSIIPSILNSLYLNLKKLPQGDFIALSDNTGFLQPLYIIGIWDDKGDIQSLKISDEGRSDKVRYVNIDISSEDIDTKVLKSYLKLPQPPLTKLHDSLRSCYFEGYLFALKMLIKNRDHFFFKKTSKNFIYKTGFYSKNRELFEEAFKLKYSLAEKGNYELTLFFVNYQFTLLPELFTKQEERELKKVIIFPYSR